MSVLRSGCGGGYSIVVWMRSVSSCFGVVVVAWAGAGAATDAILT